MEDKIRLKGNKEIEIPEKLINYKSVVDSVIGIKINEIIDCLSSLKEEVKRLKES